MTESSTIIPREPQVIVQQVLPDNTPFPSGVILDDTNFPLWSQLMEMRIGARSKSGFLTGATSRPPPGDPKLETWLVDNHRVKSWLIDSMNPTLMRRFIRLETAKEIWEAVSKTFYDGSDETQLFELNRRSFTTHQNGRSLPTYYNELVGIFQEIDVRTKTQEDSVGGVISLHKAMTRLRVHIFLAGLDSEFNHARSEILRKDPPLDLESCYAFIRKDHSQRHTMEEPKPISDSAVFLSNHPGHTQPSKGKTSGNKGNTHVCTHCGERGHSKQRCYEIIGYPEWWDFTKKPRKKISHAAITTNEDPQPATAHVTLSGNSGMSSTCFTMNSTWIIDTGATDHMTNEPHHLTSIRASSQLHISTANGGVSPVTCEGSISLSHSLTLDNVLVVPSLSYNILSVSQISTALNCTVNFWPDYCLFQDIVTHRILGYGVRRGKLYYLDLTAGGNQQRGQVNSTNGTKVDKDRVWLWHRRLGHLSFSYLRKLKPNMFTHVSDSEFKCDICEFAKSHRISYLPSYNKNTTPFMTIHSDVWGPARIPTLSGARYFVTFIDECTRMTWIALLKNKGEVCSVFQDFHRMVTSQYQCKIQVLQSDNGGEYINTAFEMFCSNHGIRHQTSCANTPQQNGLAERKNRQIMEVVRASLFGMKVPHTYWGEAVRSAAYLINRTPSRVLGFETPQRKLQLLVPSPPLPNLEPRVFGCTAYVHIPSQSRGKLDPCAVRCVFIGYADLKKGYRCYDPQTQKVYVTRDVTFHEDIPYFPECPLQGETPLYHDYEDYTQTISEPIETQQYDDQPGQSDHEQSSVPVTGPHEDVHEDRDSTVPQSSPTALELPDVSPQVPTSPLTHDLVPSNIESKYPVRTTRGIPKRQYDPDLQAKTKYPINNYVSSHRLSRSHAFTVNQLSSVSIPSNVQDALADSRWRKAMNDEMEALQKNCTWDLVPLPTGKKTVGCKWVFTVKLNPDGGIDRYKARLVAKGYTQKYGIDYGDTFAPVAKINTIRILISVAANLDWPLRQFDVKNAFLNGTLEEEVYMDLPPGTNCAGKVCKLKKALYGLKQSPRAWFGRFSEFMKKIGYKQSDADHTLFIKQQLGKTTALIVYVDDMVVTGNDSKEISALQNYLATEFELKDLGQLKYFLGIEVARSAQGISLCQRKYVLDLLTEVGMLNCKPAETPIEMNHKLAVQQNSTPTNAKRYQRLVGRLIYLSHTRPDIAYAVSVVSQFMHAPSEEHMNAVYRILRYLKSTPGKGLLFTKNGSHEVSGYTDADWAGDQTDRKSTSGYFTFVGKNLVTWRSKKQKVVARSSAEAEFRGMAQGVCELLWIKRILHDLGIQHPEPMTLHCDNKASIAIANNPVQHDRTKHVEVDRHFIKDYLDKGMISFPFVTSQNQLADVLTKAVSGKIFHSSLDKLGMIDIYSPT